MQDKTRVFFESYNAVLEKAYEDYFRTNNNEELIKKNDNIKEQYFNEYIDSWTDKEIQQLGNVTPRQFISEINDIKTLSNMFITGSRIIDKDLPEIFTSKLKSFGEDAIGLLYGFAENMAFIESEEDKYIAIMAIRLIGRWKPSGSVDMLTKLIYELSVDNEIVVEEITDALINIGIPCCDKLIALLEAKSNIGYIDEYILSVIEKIGKSNKDDRIFKCLKSTFLKMEDKVLGAMCLGDYGDGRAIPPLRGFIEKNRTALDKETYNEIKAAIKRLGGSIADL